MNKELYSEIMIAWMVIAAFLFIAGAVDAALFALFLLVMYGVFLGFHVYAPEWLRNFVYGAFFVAFFALMIWGIVIGLLD